jgi:kinesin family protein 4/21/27
LYFFRTFRAAEQKKDRLRELEGEVVELKKKEKELQRMIRLKDENEKHCEKLRNEIQTIKQDRVKLLKQMRADTESFRKYTFLKRHLVK